MHFGDQEVHEDGPVKRPVQCLKALEPFPKRPGDRLGGDELLGADAVANRLEPPRLG